MRETKSQKQRRRIREAWRVQVNASYAQGMHVDFNRDKRGWFAYCDSDKRGTAVIVGAACPSTILRKIAKALEGIR